MTPNTHGDGTSAPDNPDGVVAPLPKPTRKRRMAREPGETLTSPPGASTATVKGEIHATPSISPNTLLPSAPNKTTTILTLLCRDDGATLEEMIAATGWLPHSTRAMLTGLRKKGHVIERAKRDDVAFLAHRGSGMMAGRGSPDLAGLEAMNLADLRERWALVADSDDAAHLFRSDRAHHSDLMPPR